MYIEDRAIAEQAKRFKETGKLLISVPFSGFYETLHSHAIDDVVFIGGEERHGYDYKAMKQAYSRVYARLYGEKFGVNLAFDELNSPKEYNASSDTLLALISLDDVKKLFAGVDYEKMKKLVKDKHSSCDGFMSFVDHDYDNWLKHDLSEWTEFWLETLLQYHEIALDDGEFGVNLYYDMDDYSSEWAEAGYEECKCGECPIACEDCQLEPHVGVPNEYDMALCEGCLTNRRKEN